MSDWYEDWTGQSEALTKFRTGNVSAASTAAAIVEKAKAEAECPAEVKAKAAELRLMDFVGCDAYKEAIKTGKTSREAADVAIKALVAFKEGTGKKGTPAPAQPKPAASSYVAPAPSAAAAPAADAPKPAEEPKPVEEPWWSSTAAKAAAIGLGAGAITLAILRRK